MEGVTILNMAQGTEYVSTIFLTFAIISCILGIIILISLPVINHFDGSFLIPMILAIIVTISGVTSVALDKYYGTIHYNKYQVLIDDDVSLKEFNEKYEILSQEGLIYTIKERE